MPRVNVKFVDRRLALGISTEAFFVFLLLGFGAVASFVYSLVLARVVGAAATGLIFIGLAVLAGASTVSRLGLDNVVLRRVAQQAADTRWSAVRRTARSGTTLVAAASVILTVVVYLGASGVSRLVFGKPELTLPLKWLAVGIGAHALLFLHAELLRGIERVREAQFFRSVALPLCATATLLWLGEWGSADSAAAAYTLGAVLAALLAFFSWRLTPALAAAPRTNSGEHWGLARAARPLFWVSLINYSMAWFGPLLLGLWRPAAEVGEFAVAWRTSLLVGSVLLAANAILAPRFAVLFHRGDMRGLAHLAGKSAKYTSLAAAPLLLPCVLVPELVMGLFGSEFVVAAGALRVMAVAQYVSVVVGSVGYLLMMTDNDRALWLATSIAAVAYGVACVLLIPPYGIMGAASASAVALVLQNVLASLLSTKILGIRPFPFYAVVARRPMEGVTRQ